MKYSATPSPDNPAHPLQRSNPNGLQDELVRHLKEDDTMSSFDFGVQFLDADRMTYWGKRRTLTSGSKTPVSSGMKRKHLSTPLRGSPCSPKSQLEPAASAATYIDVTGNSTPDSTPVGSINRARRPAELACRNARMHPDSGKSPSLERRELEVASRPRDAVNADYKPEQTSQ